MQPTASSSTYEGYEQRRRAINPTIYSDRFYEQKWTRGHFDPTAQEIPPLPLTPSSPLVICIAAPENKLASSEKSMAVTMDNILRNDIPASGTTSVEGFPLSQNSLVSLLFPLWIQRVIFSRGNHMSVSTYLKYNVVYKVPPKSLTNAQVPTCV